MKFKKLLAFFLVFCILATSLFTTSVFANAEYDLKDVKDLAQHLAGWDIEVDEGTLDYNCDGRVNLKDLVLLAQFVAGWNVVIGNGSNSIVPDDAYTQSVSADVVPVDGKVPEGGVVLSNGSVSATVPEGVLLNAGATTITLKIAYLNNSAGGVVAGENEELVPVDVHIEGVSKANTVPIIINMGKVLPEGLNLGNYKFFHVEDGEAKVMTLVDSADALTAHNTFTYDANTGEVTVAMATFSPVIVVYDTTKVWNGGRDDSWYNKDATELTIANADQFYSFSIAVGLETVKNFEGKTVTLMADIDLNNRLFYPIGYYNNQKNTKRDRENIEGVAGVESSVRAFAGVFDGNGHTVKNFYQNTWEMLGDYNSGYSGTPNYYKDAMGLFGYVVNGTVKNLNVENFSSDGEFTPTGVIAAYSENSTFENIAITNCNPRVYNTGNGGIVGIGGDSSDSEASKLTFKNITIDNSNKITALWGSWDVACGGLIGMFRGPGKVDMINCHVAAQIDVFNDVCGNYQYYWYRYAGMLIGTNKNMITDANGYTVPEIDKFYAENCTVHFGEWNNYYYCELVENSLSHPTPTTISSAV